MQDHTLLAWVTTDPSALAGSNIDVVVTCSGTQIWGATTSVDATDGSREDGVRQAELLLKVAGWELNEPWDNVPTGGTAPVHTNRPIAIDILSVAWDAGQSPAYVPHAHELKIVHEANTRFVDLVTPHVEHAAETVGVRVILSEDARDIDEARAGWSDDPAWPADTIIQSLRQAVIDAIEVDLLELATQAVREVAAESWMTVDQIVARIEEQLNDEDFEYDPANNVGDVFNVLNGEATYTLYVRSLAYTVNVRIEDFDPIRIADENREAIVRALRSTAAFEWGEQADAIGVLVASGLTTQITD